MNTSRRTNQTRHFGWDRFLYNTLSEGAAKRLSHIHAFEGFDAAGLEIQPRLAACPMFNFFPKFFFFTYGLCWTDLGLGSFLNAHAANVLGLMFSGRLNTVVMPWQP